MLKMEMVIRMAKFKISNRRYLGSKAKLIDFIQETINRECGKITSFLDLFGGTGNVGWAFNKSKVSVLINDILYSNYVTYLAFFGNESINEKLLKNILQSYNELSIEEDNYFSINFRNTYFSEKNCKKIGFIRSDIEKRYKNNEINARERAILITSLLYAMDKVANTVGHYDAYRLNGDLTKDIFLKELDLPDQSINENNVIFNKDANELVSEVYADVVYIDPPYNSRQYCDAYHLLENVARWEMPKVFGTARKMDRSRLKSKYCTKSAPIEFDRLIQSINAKYIVVSYNNMGKKGAGRSQAKIDDEDIMESLSRRGSVKVFEVSHQQFTAGKSNIKGHKERLFVCYVGDNCQMKSITPVSNGYVKSPLNYTGGKYKLLGQLFKKFPKKITTFVDLFGGGFNVGANVNSSISIYNDKDMRVTRLIKLMYKYSGATIIRKLDNIIEKYGLSNSLLNGYSYYDCNSNGGLGTYNKHKYLKLREDYNNMIYHTEEKDYMLLCLIVFSFNNQIRFNSLGEFNMPIGKRDLNSSMRTNIKRFCERIKKLSIKFISKDFTQIEPLDFDKPFFYCDPPYFLGTASYNENNGWNEAKEIELLDFLKKLDKLNIPFALSNVIEHKGMIHEHLKKWVEDNHFNIYYMKVNYSNSNYHLKDKTAFTKEVLITNF